MTLTTFNCFNEILKIFARPPINMQEVFHLYKPHPISYSNMIKQLFGVQLDKLGQLADWRIRPIPKQLVSYAIRDTHYLIRAWDKVKRELISLGLDLKSILPSKAIQSMVRLYKFLKLQSAISCFDKVRLSNKRLLLTLQQDCLPKIVRHSTLYSEGFRQARKYCLQGP